MQQKKEGITKLGNKKEEKNKELNFALLLLLVNLPIPLCVILLPFDGSQFVKSKHLFHIISRFQNYSQSFKDNLCGAQKPVLYSPQNLIASAMYEVFAGKT